MGLMRKISVYILGVLLVAVSCVNEQNFGVTASFGDEVKFSAEMGQSVATKTLYGADSPDAIKVKWVNGDKVKIFGTTCAVQESDYVISVEGKNTPNSDDGKNTADGLTKTGEAGVQWGTAESSDFIAIYPSDKAEFTQNGNDVTVLSTIPSEQNYVFTSSASDNGNRWEGTNYSTDRNNPTMGDAIMYAYTSAKKSDTSVPLTFNPLTTVLKFRFMGYEYGSELVDGETIYVQSITVTAPEVEDDTYAISGDFRIGFSNGKPVVEPAGNNSNTITLTTMLPNGLYLPITAGEAVDFNVFTVPLDGQNIGGSVKREENLIKTDAEGKQIAVKRFSCEYPWKITINTQGHGSFTYTTIPNDERINNLLVGSTLEIDPYALVPGKIHKIKVPEILVDKAVNWNPENWITQIPPPVYVSELSLPGSWYSVLSAYQNNTDLTVQYNAGIRAFNLDCRLSYGDVNTTATQGRGDLRLVVAGTDVFTGLTGTTLNPGDLVIDKLKTIASLIPDDEFVVVVLTIAEKPLSRSGIFDDYSFGTVDPSQVIPAIKKMLEENANDLSLYTGEFSSMTTIDDVLGSMIVKINTNNSTISKYSYPDCSLVSFASMAMSAWNTTSDNITDLTSDYYTKMQTEPMYWGNTATDLTYYYHQAQRTTSGENTYDESGNLIGTNYSTTYQVSGVPTMQMRKDAVKDIISKSKAIYDAGSHNGWFQLGLGGYKKNSDNDDDENSHHIVANAMNGYVNDLILAKMDSDPSPVGIVLMNHCTADRNVIDQEGNSSVIKNDGIDLVKSIIAMNGKFYLNRLGANETTAGTLSQDLDVNAPAYVGPDAF